MYEHTSYRIIGTDAATLCFIAGSAIHSIQNAFCINNFRTWFGYAGFHFSALVHLKYPEFDMLSLDFRNEVVQMDCRDFAKCHAALRFMDFHFYLKLKNETA